MSFFDIWSVWLRGFYLESWFGVERTCAAGDWAAYRCSKLACCAGFLKSHYSGGSRTHNASLQCLYPASRSLSWTFGLVDQRTAGCSVAVNKVHYFSEFILVKSTETENDIVEQLERKRISQARNSNSNKRFNFAMWTSANHCGWKTTDLVR